jgi:hypothetical protein
MDHDSPAISIESYRRYLQQQLCWIDGETTHASSDSQRQCPKCRVKWSYTQASLEFAIFERFCNGERSRKAAEALGCSRNTVMGHYRDFAQSMENVVAKMLVEERIATTPQSLDEVILLEKALRTGSERRRARACLYLFLNSLGPEERLQELFVATLASRLSLRIREAKLTQTFKAKGKQVRYYRYAVEMSEFLKFEGEWKPPQPEPAEPKRTRLIESIKQEISDFIEKHYALVLPSQACRKLGDAWVDVWKSCRKTIARSGRP